MYDTIPKEFLIQDGKKLIDFKIKTFNGYKKSEIVSELEKNILSGNIEKSILWLTELHCSGYITLISNKLLLFYLKHINKANLNIIPILLRFITQVKHKIKNNDPLSLRNDQFLRNNFHNIICILTFSPKYKLIKLPAIKPEFFNMKNNENRILSPNLDGINPFIKNADDKNIIIPLAEILENIKNPGLSKSIENAVFWLNWILIYEKNFHNGYIMCTTRTQTDVNSKFSNDFTWILWDIFFKYSDNPYLPDLFTLYKDDFKKANKRQKIDIILMALLIIIDPLPKIKDTELISPEHYRTKTKITANINYQYLDISNNRASDQSKLYNNNLKKLYSPLFSTEKFPNNNIDIVLEKYDKKKPKEKNEKKEKNIDIDKIYNDVDKVRLIKPIIKNDLNRVEYKEQPVKQKEHPYKHKEPQKKTTPFIFKPKFSINKEIANFEINTNC
uniref:Uncharacterized protein n=1 Tax=viral metagenome TaxID=1070528 RepID=A0A6C0EJ97_9ZZZZ